MRKPIQSMYSEELSQFLKDQAAQMDAEPTTPKASPYDETQKARMRDGVTPMPPEFQLMHARRVRCSGWHTQSDGQSFHYTGYSVLTPDDEARYRLTDPENGLHPDDLQAFRASIQGPVVRGPVTRFFSRLMFWRE